MLRRYKEIFYGLIFGVGAVCISTFVDGNDQHSRPEMLLHRAVFVLFGLTLGWLLWRDNQGERNFRWLIAAMQKLQSGIGAPTVIIHAQTQLLLTKPGAPLPPEIEVMLRSIYEQSQRLQAIAKNPTALTCGVQRNGLFSASQ